MSRYGLAFKEVNSGIVATKVRDFLSKYDLYKFDKEKSEKEVDEENGLLVEDDGILFSIPDQLAFEAINLMEFNCKLIRLDLNRKQRRDLHARLRKSAKRSKGFSIESPSQSTDDGTVQSNPEENAQA
jgi:hypothetical protein